MPRLLLKIISLLVFIIIVFFGVQEGLADCKKAELRKAIQQNRAKINTLEVGMTKTKVMKKMGEFTCRWLVNPWKVEPLVAKGRSKYRVVYYIIRKKRPFNPVKALRDLTPLVFKDGKLIGWGNDFLRDIRKKIR